MPEHGWMDRLNEDVLAWGDRYAAWRDGAIRSGEFPAAIPVERGGARHTDAVGTTGCRATAETVRVPVDLCPPPPAVYGHGWVHPADGAHARCFGPPRCGVCALEKNLGRRLTRQEYDVALASALEAGAAPEAQDPVGWRCPGCRSIFSPSVTECPRCGSENRR